MNWHEIQTTSHDDILTWAADRPWGRTMAACAQDEGWHAEGDVWTHTKMVCAQLPLLEEWAALTPHERTVLLLTALFHDAAKPLTSQVDPATGRITSPKHAVRGEHMARSILRDLGCDLATREEIARMVRFHGRPAFLLEKSEPGHEIASAHATAVLKRGEGRLACDLPSCALLRVGESPTRRRAMATSPENKLHDLLEQFGVAMLVTRAADGTMRGRPMALAEVEPDGTLWFATDRGSGKMDEIEEDGRVLVTMQSSTKFVSLSGRATPVDDRGKLARLWKAEWKVWFPGGKDDPSILLLRIDGDAGEYWDNSGTGGVKYLIEAGKALVTGARPDVGGDPRVHGKVER